MCFVLDRYDWQGLTSGSRKKRKQKYKKKLEVLDKKPITVFVSKEAHDILFGAEAHQVLFLQADFKDPQFQPSGDSGGEL